MYSLPDIFRNWGIDKDAILSINNNRDPFVLRQMGININDIKDQAEIVDEQKSHAIEMTHLRTINTNIIKLSQAIKEIKNNLDSKINNLKTENNRLSTELDKITKNYETLKQEINSLKNKNLDIKTKTQNKAPNKSLNKPVDRNGISPSEVSLEKYFNFSHKRF